MVEQVIKVLEMFLYHKVLPNFQELKIRMVSIYSISGSLLKSHLVQKERRKEGRTDAHLSLAEVKKSFVFNYFPTDIEVVIA